LSDTTAEPADAEPADAADQVTDQPLNDGDTGQTPADEELSGAGAEASPQASPPVSPAPGQADADSASDPAAADSAEPASGTTTNATIPATAPDTAVTEFSPATTADNVTTSTAAEPHDPLTGFVNREVS